MLETLYADRREGKIHRLDPDTLEGRMDKYEVKRIFSDLKAQGLVDGAQLLSGGVVHPRITAEGIDVVEGSADPPLALNQTFNVSGPVTGSQFGNGNAMNINVHLQALVEAVQGSDMSEDEKRTALERLKAFASSPGLGNALQGLGVAFQFGA